MVTVARFTQVLHDPYLPLSGTNTIPLNVQLTYNNKNNLDCAKLKVRTACEGSTRKCDM